MNKEASDAPPAHMGGGTAEVHGPTRMTDSGPGVSRPQRPCTTPDSADKQFLPVMSPDTTSTGARGGRLVLEVVSSDIPGLLRTNDAPAKGPTMTHERKKKTHYTPTMLAMLEQCFQDNNYPTREDRELIHARTTLCVDKIKIWFQNRRCKERRRLKSLGLCSAALRMPTPKKTDTCVTSVSSTKGASTATMHPRIPNVPWCVPSLYDQYTPPCSGAPGSGQSAPWPVPAAACVSGLTGWERFCVRPPQSASLTDTLLATRENRQTTLVSSDTSQRGSCGKLNCDETGPSVGTGSERLMPDDVKMEADDTAESFATPVVESGTALADDSGGGDGGTKAEVCYQSFSCSTTTLTFADVKPEPCSTPSQMRGSVADRRGHCMAGVMTSLEEPALKYGTPSNPPTSEEDVTGPRLMPLTNVAPQMQHKPETVERYALSHGEIEYGRQSASLAYPCGYNAPSMFAATGCYGQTCNPPYWYGALPSVAPYTHGTYADHHSYDTFPGHRADVPNSRNYTSLQWDLPYGSYRQAVGGFPGLREFAGGFEPAVSGGVATSGGQAVDLSWMSGLGNSRSWDVPTNVYQSTSSRYGFSSASVGTHAAGLASTDGAKTDDGEIRHHLQNATKVDYFATKVSLANAGVGGANSATLCRQNIQRDQHLTDQCERELVSIPYENDKASDIIDEYHRQMMASYCRKECGDVEGNAATSSFSNSPADSVLITRSNPGQLARSDGYGTGAYSSEGGSCGQPLLGTIVERNTDGAAVRDGAGSRCSSCCSSSVEQSRPVSQVSVQGVFSYDSEETDTINCLSDFENLSSEDARNAGDDGTESATD